MEGSSGNVSDRYTCIAPGQAVSFLISGQDPGTKGYLVAIAVDAILGVPSNFNFLEGHEEIRLASGHRADFRAVAIQAIADPPTPADANSVLATLNFDGISYGKVPRVLELETVYSFHKTSTLLIVNRVGGSLLTGIGDLGFVRGIFTNLDTGIQIPFNDSSPVSQLNQILSDIFPVMTPVFSQALSKRQEGNLKIWATTANFGVSGAALSLVKNGKKLNSGDNLRAVTLTTDSLIISVLPPNCPPL